MSLGVWARIKYYLLGNVFYCYVINPGVGLYSYHLVRCSKHGAFLDYPQGYRGYFLCPQCLELTIGPPVG